MKKLIQKSLFILIIISFLATSGNITEAAVIRGNSPTLNTGGNTRISVNENNSSVFKTNTSKSSTGNNNIQLPTNLAPTVVTTSVNNITGTSAVLNGSVNPNGLNTIAWFETPTAGPFQVQSLGNGNNPVTLTAYNLTGLNAGTNYSFRIVATNSLGDTYGNWTSFTTTGGAQQNSAPTISATSTTSITTVSAILNGKVNPNGLNTIAWFETPTAGPFQVQSLGNGTTDVILTTYSLTGLTTQTSYTFRIVASNALGDTYGPWTSFATLANNGNSGGGGGGGGYVYVSVTTAGVSYVNSYSATLSGSVITHNLATTGWFEYGTSNNPANFIATNHIAVNTIGNSSPFAQTISGLTPGTTYYFRAAAHAPSGTRTGNIMSFTTPAIILNPIPNPTPTPNPNPLPSPNPDDYLNSFETIILDDSNILPYENNNVLRNNLGLTAALFGINTFIPNTVLGWVILLVIFLAIILIIRAILKTYRKKSKDLPADHIENLPM